MAWEARSGLKHPDAIQSRILDVDELPEHVGMAWEARSGLKHMYGVTLSTILISRNGLGSPFGIETFNWQDQYPVIKVGMAWEARSGLKLSCTSRHCRAYHLSVGMAWEARSGLKLLLCLTYTDEIRRNGLGSPFGIETASVSRQCHV